jgi:hypothetical protein
MSRTASLAAAGLAALAAGTTIAIAQSPAVSTTTLALTATPSGGSGLDLGRKGTSVGDQFFEHGKLADAGGRAAGRFQLVTQLVAGNARHGTEQNSLTLYLANGTIAVVGGHATTDRFTMPVIGGTGGYAGARGTLAIAPGKSGTERIIVTLG